MHLPAYPPPSLQANCRAGKVHLITAAELDLTVGGWVGVSSSAKSFVTALLQASAPHGHCARPGPYLVSCTSTAPPVLTFTLNLAFYSDPTPYPEPDSSL